MRKLIVLIALIGFFNANGQKVNTSQLSNSQLMQYYNQAKATGMTDMEIEQAALAKGFTMDDINKLRMRLENNAEEPSAGQRDTIEVSRRGPVGTSERRADLTSNTPVQATNDPLIFGSSFFLSGTPVGFEPNLRLATPKNYILGPDDELIVDIYGNAVKNFKLKISPEGTVKMLNFAPIYVNGLTIEAASERIVSRLQSSYAGLNRTGSYASVTLGSVRSIKVMVTGEVNRPGTFTVSSLATILNVLYLSGGPSKQGSYRQIEVIRNNNVIKKIDLYDFLVKALTKDNILLQDQDIIMVPPYDRRVELYGEIKRPGLFETREGESFRDLLLYSGGFTSNAYTASVGLVRSTGKEYRVESVNESEFKLFVPKNGDRFTIGSVLKRFENRVTVGGAVLRPGDYPIGDGLLTVKDLIKKAEGLREDAYLRRALLHRRRENLDPEVIPIALEDLMAGKIGDLTLKKNDSLSIKSVTELKESYTVSISGEVNRGGVFSYADNMTIPDLIFMAGGYSEGAISYRIDVARRVKTNDSLRTDNPGTRIFTLNFENNLNDDEKRFVLQPFDLVFVRKSPQYEVQKTVFVGGEVVYPGYYSILAKSEKVSDLIKRAGGVKPEGYLKGGTLTRDGSRVAVDIEVAVENPLASSNLLMFDKDSLFVPRRLETVQIFGAVLNPSIIAYSEHSGYKSYIAQGGGYREKARRSEGYVVYPNGITKRVSKFLFFKKNPSVQPGSRIYVPFKEESNKREISGGERAAIISVIATTAIALIRVITEWK